METIKGYQLNVPDAVFAWQLDGKGGVDTIEDNDTIDAEHPGWLHLNYTNSASANAGAGGASSRPAAPKNEQAASAAAATVKVAQRPAAVGSSNPCARDGTAARSAPPARSASKSAGAA